MDPGVREFELKFELKCLLAICGPLFYGKFMEKMGLKAPGNYSASFWISNFSILLLENHQTSIFMISGFLGLVGTLTSGFNMPRYSIPMTYNRIIH